MAQPGTEAEDKALLLQLIEENRESVDALVLYPEKTRNAIFLVAQEPVTLIKMEQAKERSSENFTALLKTYPKAIQETVWDLTRYPGLMDLLMKEGPGVSSKSLAVYPSETRAKALELVSEDYELVVEVDAIQKAAENVFDHLIESHPLATANAFRHLVELPEVLDILTQNIRLTILVGDVYYQDPLWVRNKMDELNIEVAQQNAMELEEWKASLEENPEAKAELESFALDYAEENGYDEFYYDPAEDGFYEGSGPPVVERHYYYHYPYWYGYPYWYSFPRWRPFPVWYDWGFYVRPGGYIVVFGMPSYYFTNWYFYHPYHCYRYPWLGAHFVNWWYYHPYSYTSVTVSARNWGKKNPAVVTERWMENKGKRVDQMRDYGKMEEARVIYNKKNPTQTMSQREFAERNTNKYPTINTPVKPNVGEPGVKPTKQPAVKPRALKNPNPVYTPREKPSYTQPRPNVKPKPTVKPNVQPKPNVKPKPPKKPVYKPVKPKTTPQKKYNPPKNRTYIPKVNSAKNYHQQKWNRPAPKPAPKVRVQPPSRPIPKAATPKKRKN